ncbi:MAG: hypothetical protein PF961_04995 [Planctomycetota bacterium]|nr:hypothetical protein [Planctomycetota bacterium]
MEASDKPIMYTDMSERSFIRWNLEYTFDYMIDTYRSIPADKLLVALAEDMDPPALIFTNTAIKEAIHVQGFNQGKIDIPDKFRCLLPWQNASDDEKLAAVSNQEEVIQFFQSVRVNTLAYLENLSDAEMKQVPEKSILPEGAPNRGNPIREALVMTIYQQNLCWGKLIGIKEMLGLAPTDAESWQK